MGSTGIVGDALIRMVGLRLLEGEGVDVGVEVGDALIRMVGLRLLESAVAFLAITKAPARRRRPNSYGGIATFLPGCGRCTGCRC